MNRWYARTAPLALVLLQIACTQAPPPAPDTRAADEKAIREMESQVAKQFAAKDLDKIMSTIADDASSLMPNQPVQTGKDAIRAGIQKDLADPAMALEVHTVKVEVAKSAELAYSQGTYTYNFTDPKTERVMLEKGKYVEVYRKQVDGSWKVIEDTAIPDAPPARVRAAVPTRSKSKSRAKQGK
jgi:uncharacterized protein (TIGR02246 family)